MQVWTRQGTDAGIPIVRRTLLGATQLIQRFRENIVCCHYVRFGVELYLILSHLKPVATCSNIFFQIYGFVECKTTAMERNYFGSVSTTTSGYTCQRWDSQSPHPHNLTDPNRFPDASVQAASNYCRNPDGKAEGPWCFTDDPFVEWEYCDIPICNQCRLSKKIFTVN